MDDLNDILTQSVKKAVAANGARDYDAAYKHILKAGECVLLLAKKSGGAKRKEYLDKYAELKDMAKNLDAKRAIESGKSMCAATKETAPAVDDDPGKDSRVAAPDRGGENVGRRRAGSGGGKAPDSLSPRFLDDYIGQPQAVTAVRDLIGAAKLKNSALPHLILYGSHGLGKTTFANIIANELGVGFTEVNVSKITTAEMIAVLKRIKPKDIVFIDEIHNIPSAVAESVLYSAMQDGRVTYMEGKGKYARPQELRLPPFTLIGATTEIGKLAKPFIQRAIQIHLEEYSDEVLGTIVARSFGKLGMRISDENSVYIAKRCRNNPRIANSTVKRIADKALVRVASANKLNFDGALEKPDAVRNLDIEVSKDTIDEFFAENGIDEYGLEKNDRELLKVIITRYNGGPVGLDTLARVMNEANNVIAQKYEAYLIKKGMLKIERDGRAVMPLAYVALGLPLPKGGGPEKDGDARGQKAAAAFNGDRNGGSANDDGKKKKQRGEARKVFACNDVDEIKCAKIDDLISYPENVRTVQATLDELFPDIEKQYDAEPIHASALEVDFGDRKRILPCDSALESRFAVNLVLTGYVKDIKAQTLELPYISQELAAHRYFPDFVIKDYRDRVAVIEMKNFEMISYHLNIDKYEMLKRYCEKRGYGYAEIMKAYHTDKYISVESIKNNPINSELERYIIDTIERNGQKTGDGCFTTEDFDAYIAEHGATDLTEIFTILLNNRRLKNVDRVGNGIKIYYNE